MTKQVNVTPIPIGGKKPKLMKAGRRCKVRGCRTKLTRFNKDDVCEPHKARNNVLLMDKIDDAISKRKKMREALNGKQ